MCISNRLALRLILWTKHVYHHYQLSHFLLLGSYGIFVLISSTIFFIVESLQAKAYRLNYMARMAEDRKGFISKQLLPHIFNNSRLLVFIHESKSQFLMSIFNERLETYEEELKLRPPMPPHSCTFASSFSFVFSLITTIGGCATPMTSAGRVISIIISIIGIPFTLIIVKDVAFLLAKLLHFPCVWLEACWAAFRFCTLRAEPESSLERSFNESLNAPKRRDYRLTHNERLLAIPVIVAILALVGWTTIGCIIVRLQTPWLDANTAFYHVFVSISTIGVRLEREQNDSISYFVVEMMYTLLGLSIVSLFINLLHSKFSQAYWLPGRLHLPLHPHMNNMLSSSHCASFDSDEEILSECPFNHFTTLGILQSDDKCPLLCITRRECAHVDAMTQTKCAAPLLHKHRPPSPDAVFLGQLHSHTRTSRDNVSDLIVETYGGRPPRIITSHCGSEDRKNLI